MVISNGNQHFPKTESKYTPEGHPKLRVMPPPELLREVATELIRIDKFDLAIALRDVADRWWDEPYGCRPSIWASRVEAALRCNLCSLSKTRLEVVLEKVEKLNGSPITAGPYKLYVSGEIFFTELEAMVGGEVDMDEVDAARAQLGPQEPPQDPRIFNRRQPDGSFRPLSEFFAVKGE